MSGNIRTRLKLELHDNGIIGVLRLVGAGHISLEAGVSGVLYTPTQAVNQVTGLTVTQDWGSFRVRASRNLGQKSRFLLALPSYQIADLTAGRNPKTQKLKHPALGFERG